MILCVTGPMAAGKNLASRILEEKGFVSSDADLLGHEAVDECTEKILGTFGTLASERGVELLGSDGKINRRNLGSIVFSDPALIKKQEEIVYPAIEKKIWDFISANKGRDVVLNATLLYKLPVIKSVDMVIFVDSPRIIRFFRAKKRDGMRPRQILDRFRAQKNLFAKYKDADADIVRVWNIGSRQGLEKKIGQILKKAGWG